jgi:hypothetical protein
MSLEAKMSIRVEIQQSGRTREGFAPVNLLRDDGTRLCQLDIQYSKLAILPRPTPRAIDFLLLAASVYSLDKLVLRKDAGDCWTRDFSLVLPVSDVGAWNAVKDELDRCLSFLTGDLWDVTFVAQSSSLIRPIYKRRRLRSSSLPRPTGATVCLFSGGLDSLIGAIDWLQRNNNQKLLLVGHHDGQMAGPLSDQKQLLERIGPVYPGRIRSILVRVGHSNETVDETEITLRGRSLIFIALGIFAASSLGPDIPLLIPENGTIALNAPLSPSRRGSCSTRTAHPHYLSSLSRVLNTLGLTNTISNPLEAKTKGEAVAECLHSELLEAAIPFSVSCAKRGHKKNFTHRDAKACGRCMPCIYRRAALHAVDRDREQYGDDFCIGEVDILDNGEKANDLRACLAFLRRNVSTSEISALLMANGSLDPSRLPSFAAMVQRTMDEIRTLLRDKAIPDIQRQAGVYRTEDA